MCMCIMYMGNFPACMSVYHVYSSEFGGQKKVL